MRPDDLRAFTVAGIDAEIARLTQLRNSLVGGKNQNTAGPVVIRKPKRGRRLGSTMSAEGRKRLSESMKKRWAERKKKAART